MLINGIGKESLQKKIEKMNANEYEDAIALFEDADGYDDANQKLCESNYQYGKELFIKVF